MLIIKTLPTFTTWQSLRPLTFDKLDEFIEQFSAGENQLAQVFAIYDHAIPLLSSAEFAENELLNTLKEGCLEFIKVIFNCSIIPFKTDGSLAALDLAKLNRSLSDYLSGKNKRDEIKYLTNREDTSTFGNEDSKHLALEKRIQHQKLIVNGKFYRLSEEADYYKFIPADTLFGKEKKHQLETDEGWSLAVVSPEGKFYTVEYAAIDYAKIIHPFFTGGNPLISAGGAKLIEGVLHGLSSLSGHYLTKRLHLSTALNFFYRCSVDLSRCFIYLLDENLKEVALRINTDLLQEDRIIMATKNRALLQSSIYLCKRSHAYELLFGIHGLGKYSDWAVFDALQRPIVNLSYINFFSSSSNFEQKSITALQLHSQKGDKNLSISIKKELACRYILFCFNRQKTTYLTSIAVFIDKLKNNAYSGFEPATIADITSIYKILQNTVDASVSICYLYINYLYYADTLKSAFANTLANILAEIFNLTEQSSLHELEVKLKEIGLLNTDRKTTFNFIQHALLACHTKNTSLINFTLNNKTYLGNFETLQLIIADILSEKFTVAQEFDIKKTLPENLASLQENFNRTLQESINLNLRSTNITDEYKDNYSLFRHKILTSYPNIRAYKTNNKNEKSAQNLADAFIVEKILLIVIAQISINMQQTIELKDIHLSIFPIENAFKFDINGKSVTNDCFNLSLVYACSKNTVSILSLQLSDTEIKSRLTQLSDQEEKLDSSPEPSVPISRRF